MSFGGMFDGAGSGVFSYDGAAAGGGGGGAGMHNPGRLIAAPPIPKPGGYGAPGLSLGLVSEPTHTPCAAVFKILSRARFSSASLFFVFCCS
jgi:hypothetical protein